MKKSFKYKVLITTSGLGQRLGDITKYTNKALVRVGKKPVLSYIIESYPENVEIVISIGHFGDQVRDFVKLAYPDRKIFFVKVDKYQGEGSSLGYSMLCARTKLNCPFVFHACDTIVTEKIPEPTINWNGGFKGSNASLYASFGVTENYIRLINDKGAIDYDYLHIGLVGINNHKAFWQALEELYKKDPSDSSLNDCKTINVMLKQGDNFRIQEFTTWSDIGNIEGLNQARKTTSDKFHNLDKIDEAIFIYDKFVIKFFYDKKIVKGKVKRAKILGSLVPQIEGVKGNFYRYKYVDGNVYSRVVTPLDFSNFLEWCKNTLWIKTKKVSEKKIKKICYNFYYHKTKQRLEKIMNAYQIVDKKEIINGESVSQIDYMLQNVDFDWLTTIEQYQFHGDLILENIIKTANGHKLIDWRQDFGGLLEVGDMYYDLAKLNHNLVVNHDIVNDGLFTVKICGDVVECDIMRRENLVKCQKVLWDFLERESLDRKKVNFLTALIWLNMSPLHHYPFNLFLYYFGKLNLWAALNESGYYQRNKK